MPENSPTSPQGRNTSLRLSGKANKLMPRDISESFGKLPPQALDLEEAVLGALMLEKHALTQIPFLQPDHFYRDSHKEIFQAILDQQKAGEPWDMRMVTRRLAKNGKLELVGGAANVAELTAKISSAANITFHSRVVMEMAIKRKLIELASTVHNDAYDDASDALNLLEKWRERLDLLNQGVLDSGPQRIKALWADTLLTEQPPDQNVLITLFGKIVASSGNHSLIVGKKKSRKTLFIIHLIREYLNQFGAKPEDIALFDTEQGKSHVWRVREKIHKLTGAWVPIFYLRGMGPQDRRTFIAETVEHWATKLKLIVIDGIRDCMSNINDPDETTDVIVWLENLTLANDLHVVNVLHLNKTDSNPRGHIGSELQNKAQITIEMEKDEKSGHTIVRCESSREEEFEPFAFTHSPEQLPMLVDMPVQGRDIPEPDRRNRLHIIFEDGSLRYAELIEAIKVQFECGQTKAKSLLEAFRRKGWIVKSGEKQSAIYKLMVTVATADFGTFTKEVKGVNDAPPPAPIETPAPKLPEPDLFSQPPEPPPPPIDDEPDWVRGG